MSDDESSDSDDSDISDAIDFALTVIKHTDTIIHLPERSGDITKFGHAYGKWTMVYELPRRGYTAFNIDRETLHDVLEDELDDIEFTDSKADPAWNWLVNSGTDQYEMFRSHCMCGDFKLSSNVNVVQKWCRSHKSECYYSPKIQFQYNR